MKKKTFIPISALVGALLLAVIAAMTSFVAGPNLAYAQVDSDVATLSALSVSRGTLMPPFDAADLPLGDGTTEALAHAYTVNVPHAVESLTVSATSTDRNASVAFSGGVGSTNRIEPGVGSNAIVITVTPENADAPKKYYQVTVNRASATDSTDATLMALTVIPGMPQSPTTGTPAMTTLDTKFEYSVDLTNAQDMVTIAATVSETGAVATVKKDNKIIGSSNDQGVVSITDVAIDEGDTTITLEVLPPSFVTAQKKTYTLTINRARRNASGDARLNLLRVSSGTLMPAFDAADLPLGDGTTEALAHAYTVSVPHNIVEVTVMAGTMDSRAKWEITSPDDSDTPRSGHQVDVTNQGGGETRINIAVTAEDRLTASMKYYRITVNRATVNASTVATLSALTVTPGMPQSPTTGTPAMTTLDTKFEYSIDYAYDF